MVHQAVNKNNSKLSYEIQNKTANHTTYSYVKVAHISRTAFNAVPVVVPITLAPETGNVLMKERQ